jgi:hypothetical protein
MLIMPTGHGRAVRAGRRFSVRERWVIRVVLAIVLAGVVGVAVALITAGPKSGNGCIYATIAGPVGAEQIHQCGAAARSLCQSATSSGFTADAARAIEAECRKAGLPVGAHARG